MLYSTIKHFNLTKNFWNIPYFETGQSKRLYEDIITAIKSGYLIAFTGVRGSGKTRIINRIQDDLKTRKEILVAVSCALDKKEVTLGTLMTALFWELLQEENPKIPRKDKENKLIKLIKKQRRQIALFCDNAHDLPGKTLTDLKEFLNDLHEFQVALSVILIGEKDLSSTLKRRIRKTDNIQLQTFSCNPIIGREQAFLEWFVDHSTLPGTKPKDIFTIEAMEALTKNAKTPGKIISYVSDCLELAFLAGKEKVDIEIVDAMLQQRKILQKIYL